MMLGLPYTLAEIAQVGLALDLFQGQLHPEPLRYLAYDSRQISHGRQTVFIALKTSNRDGHDFIEDAYQKGVRNFLLARPPQRKDLNFALCADPLEVLQLWAKHHRQRFSYPVIGITGSNGKTTIKEWVATLLEPFFQLVKSPMSFNSQLGVPISLLQMHPHAELALIEAGISKPGEMETLAHLIQPEVGVFTHLGAAHAEGFASEEQKFAEKTLLFQGSNLVLAGSQQAWVKAQLQARFRHLALVGEKSTSQTKLAITSTQATEKGWALALSYAGGPSVQADFHIKGRAALENATLALLTALQFEPNLGKLAPRLSMLQAVAMRMEMITDNPDVTIINDSYNSDLDSVRMALQQLAQVHIHPKKNIILSDIPHLGEQQVSAQQNIFEEATQIADQVWTVGPVFGQLALGNSYLNTEQLLAQFSYEDFLDSTVLLKGARDFELERVIPLLQRKLNATYFQIDLNRLSQNFRWLKSHLSESVKTMCMVKAASYGAGTWEIAQQLERDGAHYLAVAYASEGIELRQAGIQLPIMVMNPDLSSVEALLQFNLEPEVSNFPFLKRYLQAARLSGLPQYRIHLKLETGMGRLGFVEKDLPNLIDILGVHPDLEVTSVMSHLSASDDPSQDLYSHQQAQRFQAMFLRLQSELGLVAFRHLLNTAGLLRFPEYHFDMVRMGIGLYGIDPRPDQASSELAEIGSLHSSITQIHAHPAGDSIGYGRAQQVNRESKVAIVPIGYADGIPRSLGLGKQSFLVQGKWAPTVGRICMDMMMLDVTGIPEVAPGQEVVLIGSQEDKHLSVGDLALSANTIPYEILVRISPRVRRVYVRE